MIPTYWTAEELKEQHVTRILKGFQINCVKFYDAFTGQLLWQINEDLSNPYVEHYTRLPKTIFSCSAVCREINFSSMECMQRLRLEQKVLFKERCMEEWFFEFGYVMAMTKNSWQSIMIPESESPMLPLSVLNEPMW